MDLRAKAESFTEYRTSGERFTTDLLAALREGAPAPEPRHFLRSFANAVAFKPIFDTSAFVRAFVLDPEPLNVDRVRQSIATWKSLLDTLGELEARLVRLRRLRDRYESWGQAVVGAAEHELRASIAELRRRSLDLAAVRSRLREGADAMRIAGSGSPTAVASSATSTGRSLRRRP